MVIIGNGIVLSQSHGADGRNTNRKEQQQGGPNIESLPVQTITDFGHLTKNRGVITGELHSMIKEIVILIGDKEIHLTLDEAKQLKGELDTLFGKELPIPNQYPIFPWTPIGPKPYGPIDITSSSFGEDPVFIRMNTA